LKDWVESRLVASCRKGMPRAHLACQELLKAHSPRVLAICLGLLGNAADAEDAAQQIFLKAFMNINSLKGSQKFAAWLGRIARNHCLDILRRQKRERAGLVAYAEKSAQKPESVQFAELQAALMRLPTAQRLVLMTYYFDGKSAKSVAETFNITEGAVHTRISRARKKLRELLAADRSA